MNVPLLRKIQAEILKEPRKMNMEIWRMPIDCIPEKRRPPCNTVGCIAGWAVALDKKLTSQQFYKIANIVELGLEALGLKDWFEGKKLFYPAYWPIKYYNQLQKFNYGTKKYAEVVARRINHFIKTDGKE